MVQKATDFWTLTTERASRSHLVLPPSQNLTSPEGRNPPEAGLAHSPRVAGPPWGALSTPQLPRPEGRRSLTGTEISRRPNSLPGSTSHHARWGARRSAMADRGSGCQHRSGLRVHPPRLPTPLQRQERSTQEAAGRPLTGGWGGGGQHQASLTASPWPIRADPTGARAGGAARRRGLPSLRTGGQHREQPPHSFFFLTTGIGTTWKILALWSSVSRVTQVGRKSPLKPTNAIFSGKWGRVP